MLFGLLLTVIGGQMASMASNHMGSPNTDLLYDLLSWSSTLGALGGLCAFFWGAKEFASPGSHKRAGLTTADRARAERDMPEFVNPYVLDSKTGNVTKRTRREPH